MYRAFSRGFLLRIIHTHKYMHYTCNVIQLNTPHHNKYYPMPILYIVGFRVFFISLMETGIYVRDRSRILRWRGSRARSAGKIFGHHAHLLVISAYKSCVRVHFTHNIPRGIDARD